MTKRRRKGLFWKIPLLLFLLFIVWAVSLPTPDEEYDESLPQVDSPYQYIYDMIDQEQQEIKFVCDDLPYEQLDLMLNELMWLPEFFWIDGWEYNALENEYDIKFTWKYDDLQSKRQQVEAAAERAQESIPPEAGDYEKALHTYQQLNEIAPNDKKTELSICRCLIQLNRMEEALQMAFKVYWEHPEYQPAIFTIGDISFETSNFQQALKYWEMFLENAKTYDNIMDIGIKFWCMGEQAKGLDTLKKAKAIYENKTGNDREIFYAQLESYIPLLGQFGINETDARLLFDII